MTSTPAVDVEGRPLPKLDPVSTSFWEATTRSELVIQRCPKCEHRQFYPRGICTNCAADPEWETVSGRGTVHTFSIIRQNPAPPFDRQLPYTVAIVELEEGPRLMTNIIGCEVDDVTIGMPVEVVFVPGDEDVVLPFFQPVAS